MAQATPDKEHVFVAVERTARILFALAQASSIGVSELSRQVGLPKTTVHRILGALVRTGLAVQDGAHSLYRLGPQAVSLGLSAIGASDIRTAALPAMFELCQRTQETVTLSLRVGGERMYVAQQESAQDVRMTIEIGRRYPLYAGASGRTILAFLAEFELNEYLSTIKLERLTDATITDIDGLRTSLDEVRTAGYACSRGERDPWAASVAAPIRNFDNRVIGSLSICGPLARFGPGEIAEYGPLTVDAASHLFPDAHDRSSAREPSGIR